MMRREHWIPLAVLGLTLAFVLVSWLVRLSRGHPWLIRRKLRLGALLLGLTGAAAGCGEGGTATCYLPAPVDEIYFDSQFRGQDGLVLDLGQGSELSGDLNGRSDSAYSYQILVDGTEARRGAVVAADGAFDAVTELFRIPLTPAGLPAAGTLRVYRGAADAIADSRLICEQHLTVIPAP